MCSFLLLVLMLVVVVLLLVVSVLFASMFLPVASPACVSAPGAGSAAVARPRSCCMLPNSLRATPVLGPTSLCFVSPGPCISRIISISQPYKHNKTPNNTAPHITDANNVYSTMLDLPLLGVGLSLCFLLLLVLQLVA